MFGLGRVRAQCPRDQRIGQARHDHFAAGAAIARFLVQKVDVRREPLRRATSTSAHVDQARQRSERGVVRFVEHESAAQDHGFITGPDAARGAATLAALRAAAPGLEHTFVPADLTLLADTARLADRLSQLAPRLDAAVFCAGILSTVPEWTAERLERNFVLNYLSRYLLARRLLPQLRAAVSGRLTIVSNAGVYADTLDFEDLQHRRGKPGLQVAGRTQFANDLLATELAAQVSGSPVEVTCVAPGTFIDTDVFRNALGLPRVLRFGLLTVQRVLRRSPEWAARTPVYLAQDARAVGTNGRFYGPSCRELKVPDRALRLDRRTKLWVESEKLVEAYLPAAPSSRIANVSRVEAAAR
jgi:NAD(P)-dependent dehydrogenase (short-subunit alcohol dehydrogenase family)